MLVSRRIIVGALALMLLASVPSARADDGRTTEKTRFQEPVAFSMKAGPDGCYQLQTNLTGTGTADNTIKTTTYYTGARQIVDDREVNGQVVDPSGKSYKFQYIHHGVFTQSADRLVVHADFTDSFVIVKKGRDNLATVKFHWLFTYTPADPSVAPSAATMPFPPTDNVVKLEEAGEPLRCDPL